MSDRAGCSAVVAVVSLLCCGRTVAGDLVAATRFGPAAERADHAAEVDTRSAIIPRLARAPKLDGDLSDAVWGKAAALDGFTRERARAIQRAAGRSVQGDPAEFLAQELAPRPGTETRGAVFYTETHLWMAIECFEPHMKNIRVNTAVNNAGQRDSSVWQDDDVEIFLSPDRDGLGFYQFGINSAGVIYDGRARHNRQTGRIKVDRVWNSGVEAVAGRTAKSWTFEMAIPLKDLVEGDPTGTSWRFNVQRQRSPGYRKFGMQFWSLTDASAFREPEKHGTISFGRRPTVEVASFEVGVPRFGANACSLLVHNRGEQPATLTCRGDLTPGTYTVVATLADQRGHVLGTATSSFVIEPGPFD